MPWWKDKALWGALVVGTVLRILPIAAWPYDGCVRDECTYIRLATRIVEGEGMTSGSGWLWAPGYPFLLGLSKLITGYSSAIIAPQIAAAAASGVLVYLLARRHADRRAGLLAAWILALSPMEVWYTIRLWSECLYTLLLLMAVYGLDEAREGFTHSTRRAVLQAAGVGGLVGVCMLFRGVATYMLPLFMVGIAWRRFLVPRAWAQCVAIGLTAALVVTPYSLYATHKFEDTVVTDRTLGQMMWLGNNDFDPISFDWGNGQLSKRAFERSADKGREPCAPRSKAMERESCQTKAGIDWILAHPAEFVQRMPLRVAQLLNPHSLLTRHLRWGRWRGMPWWMDEIIIAWGAVWSLGVIWLGAVGLVARARAGRGVTISLILLYHCAAISALAGLSRYRAPLEPLLMIYAGGLLSQPRAALAALRGWRGLLLLVVMAALVPLTLWFLPSGWIEWRHW